MAQLQKVKLTFERENGGDIVVNKQLDLSPEYMAFCDNPERFTEWLSMSLSNTLSIYLTDEFFKEPANTTIELTINRITKENRRHETI